MLPPFQVFALPVPSSPIAAILGVGEKDGSFHFADVRGVSDRKLMFYKAVYWGGVLSVT